MNNDKTNRIWAYVHGELNMEERQTMEQALQNDRELRAGIEGIRRLDRELRTLMPLTAKNEDDLEKAILEAWEQSPEAREINIRQPHASLRANGNMHAGWDLQTTWCVVFAAAACLLIALSGYLVMPSAVEWIDPDIAGPAVIRGIETSAERLYSDKEMWNFSLELGNAIKVAYDTAITSAGRGSWFRTRPDWDVHARFQELRGGNFVVQVAAFKPGKTVMVKEWTQYFASREDFSSSLVSFAGTIANDLCEMKGKTGAEQRQPKQEE